MNHQTTGPTPTPEPTVRAGDLVYGNHILLPVAGKATVYKVVYAYDYPGAEEQPYVLLILMPIGGTTPQTERRWVDALMRRATDAEIADAVDVARRATVAAGLERVAALIREHKLCFESYGGTALALGLDEGEVTRLGDALDAPVKPYIGESQVLTLDLGGDFLDFQVSFTGRPEVDPEVEQEWLFTFGSGQKHDGRFVRITGTYESARARMLALFGRAWCDQYDWQRFDRLGLAAELVELPESEWPSPQPNVMAGDAAAIVAAVLDEGTTGGDR
ncbi:hypothetical protein [Micromonospora carbonacea]|uniref:Uncharacterized protein n=1 Tax=Micromonospora carbonacea TaxID=47853 RepID=A0A1C4WWK2_9ACTN|nr:hypothetical protein [Micromonospora carbonacea]SCF00514.1 hypothetical protein GA0070563_10477 [Micromonospora carbonacea]